MIEQIAELLALPLDKAKQVILRMDENGIDIFNVNKRVLHMEAKIAAKEIGVLIRKHNNK